MEDLLDLYAEPYDPVAHLSVSMSGPWQLIAETRTPIPPRRGHHRRIDYEYRCNGVCNLFTTIEPLAGWRHAEVTERRTAIDFAQQMKWLVDEEAWPHGEVGRVVLDNLNVDAKASLKVAVPPAAARRIPQKLEFHFRPKHGSSLNVG